jgi:hypothetical protein
LLGRKAVKRGDDGDPSCRVRVGCTRYFAEITAWRLAARRSQGRPADVGQDGKHPPGEVVATELPFAIEGTHQAVMHHIIGGSAVSGEPTRIAPQRRYQAL